MASTQLICPHCSSTLNFGGAIAAGTTVECLICMRAFVAANPVAVTPSAPAPVPKPKAVGPDAQADIAILSGAPTAAPAKATAKPAPTIRKSAEVGANPLMIVLCVILVALLAGGVGFAIWKINDAASGSRGEENGNGNLQIAANTKDVVTKDAPGNANDSKPAGEKAGNEKPVVVVPAEKKDDTKKKNGGDEDINADRSKEQSKPKLERKITDKSGGAEPKFDPIDVVPPLAPVQIPINVPGLSQQRITTTIENGVAYLRKAQSQDGSWTTGQHAAGYAALCGLTLLECHVPADDPAVQRAAQFVRGNAGHLGATYEISCAVLFLDRLGEPRDRALIQGLAIRLMAGQGECGGWNYGTSLPSGQDMYQLYAFLHANKQPLLLNPLAAPPKNDATPVVGPGRAADDPFQRLSDAIAKSNPPRDVRQNSAQEFGAPQHLDALPASLRKIPVVLNQSKKKARVAMFRTDEADTDNSNTQFAILALWAARRHDVPTDYAILTAYRRFIVTQNDDGGWGYARKNITGSSDSMTCAGLLALAMGHGIAPEFSKFNPQSPKDSVQKPALQHLEIQRALKWIGKTIKAPVPDPAAAKFTDPDLYLFWSIERVAMLYDLKKIDNRDWYAWGAQILVQKQQPHGGWDGYTYPGATTPINTCFALMFLRRTNLVQDLTQSLRLQSGIRDKN